MSLITHIFIIFVPFSCIYGSGEWKCTIFPKNIRTKNNPPTQK